jgi:hypothetical protein
MPLSMHFNISLDLNVVRGNGSENELDSGLRLKPIFDLGLGGSFLGFLGSNDKSNSSSLELS